MNDSYANSANKSRRVASVTSQKSVINMQDKIQDSANFDPCDSDSDVEIVRLPAQQPLVNVIAKNNIKK